jgi:hypothetical protein
MSMMSKLFKFIAKFRISNLIKKKIDHDNSIISKNSKQHTLNAESSVISGFDNWIGNVSLEDSRQFEENFSQIKTCKKRIPKNTKPSGLVKDKRTLQSFTDKDSIKVDNKTSPSAISKKIEIESPEIKNCRNPDEIELKDKVSLVKNVKLNNKSILLNISDINQEDENYTEEIDEEVNLDLDKKVSHYNKNKSSKPNQIESETKSSFSGFPIKFNTSPDEEMNYLKPNLKQYDFYNQFSIPFNNNFSTKIEDNQNYDDIEIESSDTIDPNTSGKPYMNNFKTFKSSFNGNISVNNSKSHKMNNLSINNYTSNCSTNMTNRSNASNAIITLNTPKHQKITSDHNIITKPSLNNPLSGVINQLNYSLLQPQTPTNYNDGFYTKDDKSCTKSFIKNNKSKLNNVNIIFRFNSY